MGGIFGGRKPGRAKNKKSSPAGKAGAKKRKGGKSATGAWLPWVLGIAAVLVIAGVGILKWSGTNTGQATLLTIGSEKMYDQVQAAVEVALQPVLPSLPLGPLGVAGDDPGAEAANFDWPAPELAQGAHVRCRLVDVPADIPYREVELQVAQALENTGARILWGQRLFASVGRGKISTPDEHKDQLRLDVGVGGKPTHTLVLYREGSQPQVRWGSGPGLSAWSQLAAKVDKPVVALVIDDWGYNKAASTRQLLDLPVPMTMAILPQLSFSREFALAKTDLILPPKQLEGAAGKGQSTAAGRLQRLATGCFVDVSTGRQNTRDQEKRREILVHLPMEPQGYPETDPGPQALMVGMSRHEIEARLDKALAGLDRATGVNNHMGSAATSDAATMEVFMDVLQERGLLFLDSLTAAKSVAYQTALQAGIPALKNRIFLDADHKDDQKIKRNLYALVDAARAGGFAVGIGHPHAGTARVLAQEVPRLVAEGVVFVTVSEMHALMQERQVAQ